MHPCVDIFVMFLRLWFSKIHLSRPTVIKRLSIHRECSSEISESEIEGIENSLSLDSIVRSTFAQTELNYSKLHPTPKLRYLSWEFSLEYSNILWRWGFGIRIIVNRDESLFLCTLITPFSFFNVWCLNSFYALHKPISGTENESRKV
jgi:hypothetical protein